MFDANIATYKHALKQFADAFKLHSKYRIYILL